LYISLGRDLRIDHHLLFREAGVIIQEEEKEEKYFDLLELFRYSSEVALLK